MANHGRFREDGTVRLSVTDRWILSNQYQILEHLDPGGAEQYQRAREALESGYELEYDVISSHVFKDGSTLSEEACDEVIDVLDMFRALGRSYDELEDKAGIEERRIRFQGFDGNNETEQLAYSRYLARTDRFAELVGAYGLNWSCPA